MSDSQHRRRRRRRSSGGFWGFFRKILIIGFFLGVVGMIGLFIFLKPFHKKAASFDLDKVEKLERASIIYDRHGREMGRIFVENRLPVELKRVPPHLIQALIAAEDSRFYKHHGVDTIGVCRAILLNLKAGRVTQGASTITQQLARQSYGMLEKEMGRKVTEAFLARRVERHYSKEEILQHYLNRIFFGHDFYGINSAANGYFGKEVDDLNLNEAATICGLIKSPNNFSPIRHPERAKQSRNNVLRRMVEEGFLEPAECARLQKEPISAQAEERLSRSTYVYQYIRREVRRVVGKEKSSAGGFRIFTSVDTDLQRAAQESLRRRLLEVDEVMAGLDAEEDTGKLTYNQYAAMLKEGKVDAEMRKKLPYLQGALLAVENSTGGIVSMVGGRNFGHHQFNCAVQARRPMGTAFKPLVYAAGYDQGLFPGTLVEDSEIDNKRVGIGGAGGVLGEWGVEVGEGKNRFEGMITARKSLVRGKNAATVDFGLKAGLSNVLKVSKEAGFTKLREYSNMFLGSSSTNLMEACNAFTVFPNGGTRPEKLHILQKIEEANGKIVYELPYENVKSKRVISELAAYQTHSCLAEVLEEGTAKRSGELGLNLAQYPSEGAGFPAAIAGKTGTSYGFEDNWFVGYNSEITCGVWAGFINKREIYRGAFSKDTVLPVWVDTMVAAQTSFPSKVIFSPSKDKAKLYEICKVSGKVATDACYEKIQETPDGPYVFRRSVRAEWVQPGRKIQGKCQYHTHDDGVVEEGAEEIKVAKLETRNGTLVATNQATPIVLRSPTVVGDDPWESVVPKYSSKGPLTAEVAESETEAKRATIIPLEHIGNPASLPQLEPPPPMMID